MAPPELFPLACERCRKRKQKCDRRAPACGECVRAGAECARSSREADVVRSTSGSLQLKSPITILQERLAELEELARQRGLEVDNFSDHMTERVAPQQATVNNAANELSHVTINNADREAQYVATEYDTHRGLDLLSLGAMAEPTRRTGEMLRELSIPRLIFAVTEVYGGDPERARRVDRLWDYVARDIKTPGHEANRRNIPQTEGFDCMTKYFQLADYRYPSLCRQDVESGMATVCKEYPAREGDIQANPATSFLAYMVIAIVPLVVDDFSSVHGSFVSIHMLSRALRLLEDIFRSDDGIEIIQCLRMLVVFTLQNSAAGSSWHLIGFAMKKCIALGYHREPDPPNTVEEKQSQEKSRWLFWSCYLLDRLICTALGRPYSIDDSYVTAKLPGSSSNSQLTGAASRQVHLFRYARLMSEVIKDRATHPFRHQLSRLMHWRCTAPEQVEPYPPEQRSHLKSIYDTLLLRVMIDQIVYSSIGDAQHAENAGYATVRSSTTEIIRHKNYPEDADLYTTCAAVVSSLTRVTMRDRTFLPWLTGYSAFSAALVLLYLRAKAHVTTSPSARMNLPEPYSIGQFTALTPDSAWFSGTHEEDPLRDAVAVMAIVGRQFTRVAKYKASVIKLRDLISSQAAAKDNLQVDLAEMIDGSGPDHLRRLLSITLSWIYRPEPAHVPNTTPGVF